MQLLTAVHTHTYLQVFIAMVVQDRIQTGCTKQSLETRVPNPSENLSLLKHANLKVGLKISDARSDAAFV